MQMSDVTSFFGLQNSRLFSIDTPLSGQSQLLVSDFSCSDELSQLFNIEVGLVSQDATIELKQLIAQQVSIELEVNDGSTRYFNGYVTRFIHLGTDGGLSTYSATVRPWIWMLGRRFDTRIFQDKTVEDILSDVFLQYSKLASYEFRVRKDPKPYSYCTQYRESDLNFVRRLLEQEGLYFYFEHTKDGHKLIITDDSQGAKPIDGDSTLRYATGEMLDNESVVTSWRADRQLESGRISMKTFDYKAPGARRFVSADTTTDQGNAERYEIYDYVGLHGFDSTDRGEELTRFRLEALEAAGKVFIGSSNCRTLGPGRFFQLTGHYDHDSGTQEDCQFLILSVSHHGMNNYQSHEGSATYSNSFVCIRKKIPFRPSLSTQKPMILGPQTAFVVGPKGEEIYTDSLGRVKVQFHWDRLGQRDHRSSCWVRVGQPWAGGGFGAVQIPRIGDEVVVSFLDGNPDRPLITSRVYNAQNTPPWALPANATQSGFLTRSSKGATAANANAIRFEDKRGQEEVWIHAEKDQRIEVENNESHTVGNDRVKTVDHDETVQVNNDRTETVGNNETITVGVNRTEQVGGNETLSVGGNRNETISGMENLVVALTSTETVGLAKALTVGGAYTVTVAGAMNSAAGLASAEEVGLSKTTMVGKSYTITAGDRIELKTGSAVLILESNGHITLRGTQLLIEGSGPVQINGKDVDIN
ncbi:type IV secretion protein Rhs [Caballeronia mineralivorans PML1(12)]|uniref:Type IV secretion protein Rhs n=1 Tax=Caballeronia mineralivorans PML1(12) TaxID=908627 RepID=A0A0J1FRA2_9BURK|nr:type VI secretion system tip protein VgrG [Caballeronia mineralivorans]KLU22298.1 type IV secretion protein Rhs [Caballeronia mineralivorans PML1(12)]